MRDFFICVMMYLVTHIRLVRLQAAVSAKGVKLSVEIYF